MELKENGNFRLFAAKKDGNGKRKFVIKQLTLIKDGCFRKCAYLCLEQTNAST
jgi:hypothetical protein